MQKKCDGEDPCSRCTQRGVKCQYIDNDKRRKRRTTLSHIQALEKHASELEQTLRKLVDSIENPDEVNKMLKQISEMIQDTEQKNMFSKWRGIKLSPVILRSSNSTSIFGPASIYNESLLIANEQLLSDDRTTFTAESIPNITRSNLSFRPSEILPPMSIRNAVSLFFQFQYPSIFSFIHRESFLYYFLSNDYDNEFVSEGLVFAISAVGSRMSENEDLRLKSEYFYDTSKLLIFKSNEDRCFTDESSIANLQALLCLALYDIGRGNLTSGWLLSGLAFRMGFEFGFELDPKDWQILNLDKKNDREKKKLHAHFPFQIQHVKSRIYWGCYIADNFISLVLGRPTTLKLSDTNMPESEDMGDLTNIEEFMYHDPKTNAILSAFPTIIALVELIKLSNYILGSVFEPPSNVSEEQLDIEYSRRLKNLYFYNRKLLEWKSKLPSTLQWNRESLENNTENTFLHTHKCYFYIVSLCLNRPFIQLSVSPEEEYEISPVSICDNIIDEIELLIANLETTKGIDGKAIGILLVFCVIMPISILYIKFSMLEDITEKLEIETKLKNFSRFLDHCSAIWHVARKPSNIVKERIDHIWNGFGTHKNKSMDQSSTEILNARDTISNVMDGLFNSNVSDLSLLRHDLTSLDWENFFDFDLNF